MPMLYVVNTPPIYGAITPQNPQDTPTQADGNVYGLTGHLSYPKLQDLQAVVELWAQYLGCLYSEWQRGGTSLSVHWDFWNQNGGQFFTQSKSVFDWIRLRYLCDIKSPDFWFAGGTTFGQVGGLFLGTDPFAGYAPTSMCEENVLFANCDHSEGCIDNLFAGGLPQGDHWYYAEDQVSGVTKALLIDDLKPRWYANRLANKKDVRRMWSELQPVSNNDLYLLTPCNGFSMFARNGMSHGEPFTAPNSTDYPAENTWVRQRRTQSINHKNPAQDIDTGYVVNEQGYIQEVFNQHHSWGQEEEDLGNNQFQYVWNALDEKVINTSNELFLWKMCPVPSSAFARNVNLSRELMLVWKVDYKHEFKYSDQASGTTDNKTVWLISKQPFADGSDRSRFVDIDGFDYGNVKRWRFPFTFFDGTNQNNNIYHHIMDDQSVGFFPSYDNRSGWGLDRGIHSMSTRHYIYNRLSVDITLAYFYSCQKNRLTQSVTYPLPSP